MTTVPTAIHVEVLPARLGDCLLVECPRPSGPTWRMLVDGGPPDTWPLLEARLRRLDPADRHIDVAVITHIDNDHIGGMLAFLSSDLAADVGDFWFNGRTHLPSAPGIDRSIEQGEDVVAALLGQAARTGRRVSRRRRSGARGSRAPAADQTRPWNEAFGRGPIDTGAAGGHLEVAVPDGPTITVLSPTTERLARLADSWSAALRDALHGPVREVGVDVLAPLDDLQHIADAADGPGRLRAQRQQHRPARRAPRCERPARGRRVRHRPRVRSARPGAGPRRRDHGRRRAQAAPPRQPGQRRHGAARGGAGQPLPRLHQRRRLPPPRRRRDRPRRARRAGRTLPVVQLPHAAHRAVGRPASHSRSTVTTSPSPTRRTPTPGSSSTSRRGAEPGAVRRRRTSRRSRRGASRSPPCGAASCSA